MVLVGTLPLHSRWYLCWIFGESWAHLRASSSHQPFRLLGLCTLLSSFGQHVRRAPL